MWWCPEESGYEKNLQNLIGRNGAHLAINSIGGDSALRLLNCLSPGSAHITIGAMTFEAIRFPHSANSFLMISS